MSCFFISGGYIVLCTCDALFLLIVKLFCVQILIGIQLRLQFVSGGHSFIPGLSNDVGVV